MAAGGGLVAVTRPSSTVWRTSSRPPRPSSTGRSRQGAPYASDAIKEAVDMLNTASSGSSLYGDVPIQRIERDIQALNVHALMHLNANLERYGRMLCGLPPNPMYL
ncbi:hypothetical protein [Micromonospora gifhornensis]|uniref:hypothetical protein n=1 Tax=Micromonospora gifhornensis TaxID=84594 RepID=UPI00364DBFAE